MRYFSRVYHQLKFRHYMREASRLQRDLAEYIESENGRITILLHRAAWHRGQASGQMERSFGGSPGGENPKLIVLQPDNSGKQNSKSG